MDCEQFTDRLESLAESETLPGEIEEHAGTCAECGRRLSRARSLVALLRAAPAEMPPPWLRSRVLAAARPRPLYRVPLVRVAAAVLVMVAVSFAVVLLKSPGLTYEPLELTVLPMADQGSAEEEFALELMYGPGVPIGEWSGDQGFALEDEGSADER